MVSARHAILRADASPSMGTGHVTRCRTLGSALVAQGWTATLATRGLPEGLASSVRGAGLSVVSIPPELEQDSEPAMLQSLADDAATLIVGDHYGLGPTWFDGVRQVGRVIMAIDDLGERRYPVDVLLHQNPGTDESLIAMLAPEEATVLVGPRFALVPAEFANLRIRRRERDGRVERIHIFLSGSDEHDVTRLALRSVWDLELSVDVVVGSIYPSLDLLRAEVAGRSNVELHVDTDDMADLIDRADLAIGAPGSASFERCALGLPTVLISLADNQRIVERSLVDLGAAVTAGWYQTLDPMELRSIVSGLIDDPGRVTRMARAASSVTDGRGTQRVVASIERRISA